jgi:D-arabinose 1-dehydrogenase-like Zn-dependent alcohol dehydrogenase
MKAVQVIEFGKPYEPRDIEIPRLDDSNPFDVLVKVAVASYCHTDSMAQAGIGGFNPKLPCTASHEGAGTIEELGYEAKQHGFNIGQRVMCGLQIHPCGGCQDCLGKTESHRQYCEKIDGYIGLHLDGCFAEYVKVDARNTTPLPDQISFLSAAPLACAGRTIWRGIQQTGLLPGQAVGIIGSGGGLGYLGKQEIHTALEFSSRDSIVLMLPISRYSVCKGSRAQGCRNGYAR